MVQRRRGVAIGAAASWPFLPDRVKNVFVDPPPAFIPDAEVGQVTLETVYSESRGMDVDLFTAVPAGYGSGKGLPVVVVCHGATATPADYEPFGLPQFLTAAVDAGAEPFVLAGAYGSALCLGAATERRRPAGDGARRDARVARRAWL